MKARWAAWTCACGYPNNRRSYLQCGSCRADRPSVPLPTSHPLPDVQCFEDALAFAIDKTEDSRCQKSKRGVTIWNPATWEIDGVGTNGPPHGFACDGSIACRMHCNKLCTHAEVDALMDAGTEAYGDELLHVKVVDGRVVVSGPPSCWQCSREIVAAGISGVWLLHETGWRRYTAEAFHEATLRHCELPVIRAVKSAK